MFPLLCWYFLEFLVHGICIRNWGKGKQQWPRNSQWLSLLPSVFTHLVVQEQLLGVWSWIICFRLSRGGMWRAGGMDAVGLLFPCSADHVCPWFWKKKKTHKKAKLNPQSTEENSAYDSRRNMGLRIIIPCTLGSDGEHCCCKLPHAFSHSLIPLSFLGQFPGKRAVPFHF